MMREGLRTLISREQDLVVCGEAETAAQALGSSKTSACYSTLC
jgi:DNA-binding NarL/FixJ family response regulator